ncbi:hypothetical protein [Serratia marcescens]|uniref:hypothetical protein n=1 Tax=Serratia marcescens TaxID=615 RepID=UPI002468FD52|nr:hypothetical protein [Serratia marcescens]WGL80002.1 hypothetical protein QFB82_12655 [Serratia marcescens]
MSEMFEIAYAAATNRLCLFTGTGFSKEVSNGDAPTWKGLLEELCGILPNADKLNMSLFPKEKSSPLSLEETAQIISIKLAAQDKDIHEEVSKIISKIQLGGVMRKLSIFFPTVLSEL